MENRIKEARALAGMSQKFLAEQAGLHRVHLHKVENDMVRINVEQALMIARILMCKVEDIFLLT